MKEYVFLFIKGFIIGIGKIIPGVSGAMIALSLNVYEKAVFEISNLFKNIKSSVRFLFPLGFGILVSIAVFSKVIIKLLELYYLPVMLLFIGLIIGNNKNIKNGLIFKKKQFIIFLFSFIFSISIIFLNQKTVYEFKFLIIFIMGIVEAICMIVPGLSGTAMLMAFGYYKIILEAFATLNINILFPLVIGIFVGILITTKIIDYCFRYFKTNTYIVIYGCSYASIVLLFLNTLKYNYDIYTIIISIILLVIGYLVGKKF